MFDLQASRFGDDGEDEGVSLRCPRVTTCRPALPAMWRALKRGYEAEPRLLTRGVRAVAARGAARRAAGALAEAAGRRRAAATGAGWWRSPRSGLGVSAAATWFLRVISDRMQRRFRDRVTIALESHVAQLQASVATIEHHERPGIPRPARGAARSGVRARPHVHVAVLDLRLDPAARRDRWRC